MSKLKQLINPPIQAILLGSSALLLGIAAWQIVQLKLQDADPQSQAGGVNVQIPDAASLATPNIEAYTQSVAAPLFWASRQAVKEEVAAIPAPVVAAPVDATLPAGRLVGIIDNQGTLFAVMSNDTGASVRLHRGDKWGAWDVAGIDPQRVILTLGEQRQEIPLVADFAAPQESPQLAQTKAQQQMEQQARQQAMALAAQQQPASNAASPEPNPAPAPVAPPGLPFPADAQQQPPALSVEDALAARQRLMASRWGALSGEQPAPAQGQAPTQQ